MCSMQAWNAPLDCASAAILPTARPLAGGQAVSPCETPERPPSACSLDLRHNDLPQQLPFHATAASALQSLRTSCSADWLEDRDAWGDLQVGGCLPGCLAVWAHAPRPGCRCPTCQMRAARSVGSASSVHGCCPTALLADASAHYCPPQTKLAFLRRLKVSRHQLAQCCLLCKHASGSRRRSSAAQQQPAMPELPSHSHLSAPARCAAYPPAPAPLV